LRAKKVNKFEYKRLYPLVILTHDSRWSSKYNTKRTFASIIGLAQSVFNV